MDANNHPGFYRQLGKEPQELITSCDAIVRGWLGHMGFVAVVAGATSTFFGPSSTHWPPAKSRLSSNVGPTWGIARLSGPAMGAL
jgi:hypothetical protein